MNPWRSLAENTCFDFLKPTGGFTVSRVLRSQMIYAACLILCAAGSLFTSNSADSANVFAESNITLSNGVLPMISIIQYPYINGGKPNYKISESSMIPPSHTDPTHTPPPAPTDHEYRFPGQAAPSVSRRYTHNPVPWQSFRCTHLTSSSEKAATPRSAVILQILKSEI